jgi:outer membrane lipoprotein-sorting protein
MYLAPPIFFLFAFLLSTWAAGWITSDTEELLNKMEAAYVGIEDYRARLQIKARGRDGSLKTKKVLYTFKKPQWVRLDFELPHPGMVLIYPDKNGKVLVRPSGWARFLKLHLAPDNFLLKVSPGQRIDQTDLGLLIRNISHSLTDRRRGQMEVEREDGYIRLRVLADNHFREGIVTRYQFVIDRRLWLPVEVEESTPDGILERLVVFRSLRVNIGVPDSFFQLNGE